MKTVVIKEKTEEDVAAVMVNWLAEHYGINVALLAKLIGTFRSHGYIKTSSEGSKPITIERIEGTLKI